MKQTSLPKLQDYSSQALQLRKFAKATCFLTDCNPSVLNVKYADVRTAKEALRITDVQLSHIAEAYGNATLKVFVKTHLALLQKYLNVKDDMLLDSLIIEELSGYVIEDFVDFNLAEFTLVFRKIKKGDFGLIYARVDPIFILKSFKTYQEGERMEAKRQLNKPIEETMEVEFTQAYYEGAKRILSKDFKTNEDLNTHLLQWKGFLCQRCRVEKVGNCKSMAQVIINKEVKQESVSTYAISSWLLCWNV